MCLRLRKSWTKDVLSVYKISIVRKDEQSFFVPSLFMSILLVLFNTTIPLQTSMSPLALIKRFWLTETVMPNGYKSAVNALTSEFLRTQGSETKEIVVCTKRPLHIYRRRKDIQMDICIMDRNSEIQ